MKKNRFYSVLMIFTIIGVLSSCHGRDDQDLGGLIISEQSFVITDLPEVGGDYVKFKGNLNLVSSEKDVAYGFFWYDPNSPGSAENPNRVDVGTTDRDINFSIIMRSLPKGKDLIVCAFMERGGQAEMNIGDEVPFVLP